MLQAGYARAETEKLKAKLLKEELKETQSTLYWVKATINQKLKHLLAPSLVL